MSHFVCVVLSDGTQSLEELLEPYNENGEVEPYSEECYCVGHIARLETQEAVEETTASYKVHIEQMRTELRRIAQEAREIPKAAEVGPLFIEVGKEIEAIIGVVGSTPELEDLMAQEKELAVNWFATHERMREASMEVFQAHPMHDKPDPECDECGGTGTRETTYNPKSKWDWWQVGGRWTGFLTPDYEPEMDPRNKERCPHCKSTGKRFWREEVIASEPDGLEKVLAEIEREFGGAVRTRRVPADEDDPLAEEGPCNACDGTGIMSKWPTEWATHDGDAVPAAQFLALLKEGKHDVVPYALLTPDGVWHERGQMGWWGMSSNDMSREDWSEKVLEIVEAAIDEHNAKVAVVVDCHI